MRPRWANKGGGEAHAAPRAEVARGRTSCQGRCGPLQHEGAGVQTSETSKESSIDGPCPPESIQPPDTRTGGVCSTTCWPWTSVAERVLRHLNRRGDRCAGHFVWRNSLRCPASPGRSGQTECEAAQTYCRYVDEAAGGARIRTCTRFCAQKLQRNGQSSPRSSRAAAFTPPQPRWWS